MSKSWKIALAALLTVAAPGCKPNAAIQYNNEVAGATLELQAAGKQFGERLRPCFGNPARCKELHAETLQIANATIKKGRALTPPNTCEGKALHRAFQSYLDTEEQIIRADFATIARHAGQSNLTAMMPIINAAQRQEQAKAQQLKTAQQEFAKANNFTLR
jgi:hypothetical protein